MRIFTVLGFHKQAIRISEFLVLAVLWWGGRFEKDTVQSCSGVAVKPVSPCMLTICKSALREMSLKGH